NFNNIRQNFTMSSLCEEIENAIKIFTKPEELSELESKTFLTLKNLITPYISKKRTMFNPPRAQNRFMIFRKDLTAYLNSLNRNQGTITISRVASDLWNGHYYIKLWNNINDVKEIKEIYHKIAEIAKIVHNILFPNYKYSPKKKLLSNKPLVDYIYAPQQPYLI
ncbi:1329_t:CDS:1, partial [Gigaspora margarita]